jgi:hypothetical protein
MSAKNMIDVEITVDGKKNVFVCMQGILENNLLELINKKDLPGMEGDGKFKKSIIKIGIEGADRLYAIIKNRKVDSVIVEIEYHDYPYYAKNMNVLELELYKEILDAHRKAVMEFKCDPGFDFQLLTRFGAIKSCQSALDANAQSESFRKLLEYGCPGLTVEGIILEHKYSELFSEEEKSVARKRFREYGYKRE